MRRGLRSLMLGVCAAGCAVEAWGQAGPGQSTGSPPVQVAGSPQVRASDSVTVSADRGLVGVSDSATSVAVVSAQQMGAQPGLTLDDRLHQVAGFQLFRRTSSWTANPTTEGVSLRGLGSTAASRTLVVSGQVPLNDAFGGWVHWDEIPSLGIEQVNLLRGGAADLYGSSAIGGAPLASRMGHFFVRLCPGGTRFVRLVSGLTITPAPASSGVRIRSS